jgi:hypothetical protein
LIYGTGELYEILPASTSGQDSFTVNSAHILVIRCNEGAAVFQSNESWLCQYWQATENELIQVTNVYGQQLEAEAQAERVNRQLPLVVEVSVADYLQWSAHGQRVACMFKPSIVTFPTPAASLASIIKSTLAADRPQEFINLTAWLIGRWLAEGRAERQESELNCKDALNVVPLLRAYNMMDNKHIPLALLTESVEVRMNLLSGIIDATGEPNHKDQSYQVCVTTEHLAMQITSLAKSLGFNVAHVDETIDRTAGQSCVVYSLNISGNNLSSLYQCVRSVDKRISEVSSCAGSNSWPFRVQSVGCGGYYGFTVSGLNERLLMKDFTVTHNSSETMLVGKGQNLLKSLHQLLRPFMLRRLKSAVEQDLLPKKETLVFVGMSSKQMAIYKSLLMKDTETLLGQCKERSRLMNLMMQLRKCLAGNSLITLADGTFLRIDQMINKELKVLGYTTLTSSLNNSRTFKNDAEEELALSAQSIQPSARSSASISRHSCLPSSVPDKNVDRIMNEAAASVGGVMSSSVISAFLQPQLKCCISLTFCDGSKLSCTPDHRVKVKSEEAEWKEAGLLTSEDELLGGHFGSRNVIYCSSILHSSWSRSYTASNIRYQGKNSYSITFNDLPTVAERKKLYALGLLIGYTISSGVVYENERGVAVELCVPHRSDLKEIRGWLKDCFCIEDELPVTADVFPPTLCIPSPFNHIVLQLVGAKTWSARVIPDFIVCSDCPRALIVGFLRGLFGGNGVTNSYTRKDDSFEGVRLIESSLAQAEATDLSNYLTAIQSLLSTHFSIESVLQLFNIPVNNAVERIVQSSDDLLTNDLLGSVGSLNCAAGRIELRLTIPSRYSNILFQREIGFAGCIEKRIRNDIACLVYRMMEYYTAQAQYFIDCAYQAFMAANQGNCNNLNDFNSISNAAAEAMMSKYGTIHPCFEASFAAISCPTTLRTTIASRESCAASSQNLKNFDVLQWIGGYSLFDDSIEKKKVGNDVLGREELILPVVRLCILKKELLASPLPVYDLTVAGTHSFLASGCVVHNCANHPYLFEGVEEPGAEAYGDHLITTSGKMIVLDKLLAHLFAKGSRVLIFSQMTRTLDIIDDYMIYRGYKYCRIDGNTAQEKREEQMHEFNAEGSEKFCFLLSTRAGGLGINLYTADIVILYDSDWNPQMDLQAMDRAHRIGQKKQVYVYRFVTENSIEEKIIERAEIKLRLDAMVVQAGKVQQRKTAAGMSNDDVASMIRFGADKIIKAGADAATQGLDEDIMKILSKGEEKTAEINNKVKSHLTQFDFSFDGSVLLPQENGLDDRDIKIELATAAHEALGDRKAKNRQNLNVAQYYREALKIGDSRPKTLLEPVTRIPIMRDFQFYNKSRIEELSSRERKFYEKYYSSAEPPRLNGLTEEEQNELIDLLNEGFGEWSFRDFAAYITAVKRYGRKNLEKITEAMTKYKPKEEVQRYQAVFLSKGQQLTGKWAGLWQKIEAAEKRIALNSEMENLLDSLLRPFKSRLDVINNLKILYTNNNYNDKGYSVEADRLILYLCNKFGYGEWKKITKHIRRDELFRFDYILQAKNW